MFVYQVHYHSVLGTELCKVVLNKLKKVYRYEIFSINLAVVIV